MFFIKVTNDWIRATDLWCWKQLLYQLSHTHPVLQNLFYFHWLNGIQKLNNNLELDLRDLVKIRYWCFSTFKTILQVVNVSKKIPRTDVVVQWSAYSPSSLTIRVRFSWSLQVENKQKNTGDVPWKIRSFLSLQLNNNFLFRIYDILLLLGFGLTTSQT